MRITAKIATAGVAGLSRFPVPNATIDECLAPDGRLDESKARAALNVDQIRVASTDTRRTVAFSMEYLKQIRSVVEHLAASLGADASVDDERGYRTEAQTAGDRRCERNMRRNRVAYVRTDVTDCLDGIHVKLTVANPRETVGNAECFAHDYAVMCARVLNYLKDNITTARIVLIEGEGAAGIYDEARRLDERCDLRRRREGCANLRNGYCSPCQPDCPLYRNGKCKDPTKEET